MVARGRGQGVLARGRGQGVLARGRGQDVLARGRGQGVLARGRGQGVLARGRARSRRPSMPLLKSFFSRWRRSSSPTQAYQPISSLMEEVGSQGEDEDVDELMRMASEADSIHFQDSELNLAEGAVFRSASGSLPWRQPLGHRLCRVTCQCGVPSSGEKMSPWLLLLSLSTILAVMGVSVALGLYSMLILKPEPVIDKSIDAFSIPNHVAYIHYDAFNLARRYNSSRHMRLPRDTSRAREAVPVSELEGGGNWRGEEPGVGEPVKRWKMQVIYLAVGDQDHNVFTEERLKMIHKVERDIVSHPRWKEFCLRDPHNAGYDPAVRDHNDCAPLNSLLSYFFPSTDDSGKVFYDGFGDNLGDIESALHLAMNHDSFYYFVDSKINKTYQKSHMLRTEVLFGAPLPGFLSLGDHSQAQSDKFKEFVITYIDLLSKASTDKVHVLYGGNELFDYEVESTFWSDVKMAIIAASCIAVLMFIMTSFSFFLTFTGLLCIALSFPLAIFFYRVVFNIVGLGIMNGAAAFVIIGIGVDDVFVFINIFRQSSHLKTVTQRLKYTCRTAGVATFFTSFTTAIAFASNMTSSIPAVYTFGLFMSLIVAGCWITVFLVMPSSLYLYAFWFEPLEKMCGGICCHCVSGPEGRGQQGAGAPQGRPPSSPLVSPALAIDDDDVPLLHMEHDLEEILVDIYYFFQKSTLRQSNLRELQGLYDVEQRKMLKHGCTRWLSIARCIKRLLESWEPLKHLFYKELKTKKAAEEKKKSREKKRAEPGSKGENTMSVDEEQTIGVSTKKLETISDFLRSPTNRLCTVFLSYTLKVYDGVLVKLQAEQPLI
ncbi:hypothetical protein ACOMHN_033867 [Nucella lapillus]